jgi:hypothetical protein
LTPLIDSHLVRLDKINSLYFTEPDTLRVPVTVVALENLSVGGIKIHGAERTYANTRTAANADIMINGHLCRFLVA